MSTFVEMVRKQLTVMARYPVNFVASFLQVFLIVAVFTINGLHIHLPKMIEIPVKFQFYRLAIYLDRFFRDLSGRQFCALLRADQYLTGLLRGHLFHWLTLARIQNIKKCLYACGRGRGIGGVGGCCSRREHGRNQDGG